MKEPLIFHLMDDPWKFIDIFSKFISDKIPVITLIFIIMSVFFLGLAIYFFFKKENKLAGIFCSIVVISLMLSTISLHIVDKEIKEIYAEIEKVSESLIGNLN